jgi:predicted transporter
MKHRLVLLLFVTLCCVSDAIAQTGTEGFSIGRENLKGVKAVYVSVDVTDAHIGSTELTQDQLLSDVQSRLQKAGIRVATEQEWVNEDDVGNLTLVVTLLKLPVGLTGVEISPALVVYNIQLDLQEAARLDRAPGKHIMATIYAVATQTGAVRANAIKNLRVTAGNSVDVFVKDYIAANPK